MDNDAHEKLKETRGQWSRQRHAQLLNKLADDGCPLVVFDVLLREPKDPGQDARLAEAMQRLPNVALLANLTSAEYPGTLNMAPLLPTQPFLDAAKRNTGIGLFDDKADSDRVIRRHWPFPSPQSDDSLAWVAARLAGGKLSTRPEERWLRYYGSEGAWTRLSYRFAEQKGSNYFRDKIVFIGSQPERTTLDEEKDKFRTPYTRWNQAGVGGVDLHATAFLNLV